MITTIVDAPENYKNIAHTIYTEIGENNSVLFLNGSMGIGKTTFTSTLLRFFNCFDVSSSSYGILNQYRGSRNVIHCDFYRFQPDTEFFETEVFPLLGSHYLLVFEWAVPKIIINNVKHFQLNFSLVHYDQRKLDFQIFSPT
tara:strand:+ start:7381 stop:7806 length:426 start_codon:yes stop_codon:yes gene_type:complete